MKKIFILSGPSGVGKTVLSQALMTNPSLNLARLITTTTRSPRSGEINGEDYVFINKPTFEELIAKNDFAEWAEVFGNYYGTSKSFVEQLWKQGKNILLIIDWKGHQSLRKVFNQEITSIFLLPPNMYALEERLTKRNLDDKVSISKRLQQAPLDMAHQSEYDYVIINDNLTVAQKEIENIILRLAKT